MKALNIIAQRRHTRPVYHCHLTIPKTIGTKGCEDCCLYLLCGELMFVTIAHFSLTVPLAITMGVEPILSLHREKRHYTNVIVQRVNYITHSVAILAGVEPAQS